MLQAERMSIDLVWFLDVLYISDMEYQIMSGTPRHRIRYHESGIATDTDEMAWSRGGMCIVLCNCAPAFPVPHVPCYLDF